MRTIAALKLDRECSFFSKLMAIALQKARGAEASPRATDVPDGRRLSGQASFRTVSASVRGRFLAAVLGHWFERGLDMPALRRSLLLQPRVIAR